MSVELYIGKEFENSYEREAVNHFANSMSLRFGNKDELYIILANYMIGGREVDLTVLKKDAIIVIELKENREPFIAHENGEWITNTGHKIGYNGMNPYRQVMEYRKRWVDLLNESKYNFDCLKKLKRNHRSFWYIKGFVVISPSLHEETKNRISADNWWFRLYGLNELSEKIELETNRILNFSNDELRFIAKNLLSISNQKNIQTTNELDAVRLAKQIKKESEELLSVIENEIISFLEKKKENENKIINMNIVANNNSMIIDNLKKENESLYNEIKNKDGKINQLRIDIEKIKEPKHEYTKNEAEKFKAVVDYILLNFMKSMDNKKARELVMLSSYFGIKSDEAKKLIKNAIEKIK